MKKNEIIKPASFKSTLSCFNLFLVLLVILFRTFDPKVDGPSTNKVVGNDQNLDVEGVNDKIHFYDSVDWLVMDEEIDASGNSDDQRTPIPPMSWIHVNSCKLDPQVSDAKAKITSSDDHRIKRKEGQYLYGPNRLKKGKAESLYQLKGRSQQNKVGFLHPEMITPDVYGADKGVTLDYLARALEGYEFYVTPYLQGAHYVLFIICPKHGRGFILDSQKESVFHTEDNYRLAGLVDSVLGGSLKWELPTVNRQPSTWECGYYIPWGEERRLENKELDAVIGAWFTLWRGSKDNASLIKFLWTRICRGDGLVFHGGNLHKTAANVNEIFHLTGEAKDGDVKAFGNAYTMQGPLNENCRGRMRKQSNRESALQDQGMASRNELPRSSPFFETSSLQRSMFEISGNNFNDWFRQLKLVLRVERKLFVIEQPISLASPTDSEYLRSGMRMRENQLAHMSLDEELCETGINPIKKSLKAKAKDNTCHHCKEVGHCRRNCPAYLAKLIKKKKKVSTASSSDVFIIELFSFPTKFWVYDTSCGTHICNTKHGLGGVRKLKQGEAIGSFDLALPNSLVICLDNFHYGPSITRGVVSVYRLVENGFVYTKRVKHYLDSTYLWHCHLAHINKKRIEKLQQEGLLKSTDDESFDQCVSCLSAKMTRKSFPHRPERVTDLLGIIHTDVCVRVLIMSPPVGLAGDEGADLDVLNPGGAFHISCCIIFLRRINKERKEKQIDVVSSERTEVHWWRRWENVVVEKRYGGGVMVVDDGVMMSLMMIWQLKLILS
ncbi:retrotransposon protein, putative, ty1-copia subclass [Tanacetum coccineum]